VRTRAYCILFLRKIVHESANGGRLMGKKRRRSEAGESECDESPAASSQKKRHHEKWSIPEELYRKVSGR